MFLLACLYDCKKMLDENFVCSPKNKNVPQNFSQGDKLSLSDQILAQTLLLGLVKSAYEPSGPSGWSLSWFLLPLRWDASASKGYFQR